MIARIWHGITKTSKADEYLDYLNKTGVIEYRATPGNLGVYVLRKIAANEAHFLLLTLRESEAAIKKFTSSDVQKARYYPQDRQYLVEFEPTVMHYVVILAS